MKTKTIILSIIISSFFIPSMASNNIKLQDDFSFAKDNFKWVKKNFYYYLNYQCYKKKLDPLFMLSIAQVESRGKNIISRKNKNGTRDIGVFQINQVHVKKLKSLLNYKKNIDIATWYFSLCIKKAKGNKKLACIYYNAGLNCNVKKYMNSKRLMRYPNKILKIYKGLVVEL